MPVGIEVPRLPVLLELDEQRIDELAFEGGSLDRYECFHAVVEVAGHDVGRAEVGDRRARTFPVGEVVHACVLEIPADERSHPDVLGQT